MQATMMEAKTLRELPFAVGVFQGRGVWADRQGQQGDYLAELMVVAEGGGVITHVISRVFLKDDGDAPYKENLQVRFIPSADSFFEVAIRFEGKEYCGHGYCFGNRCHYEVVLAGDDRLEATCALNGERIQTLGSSTRNGALTAWAETLTSNSGSSNGSSPQLHRNFMPGG